MADEESQPQGKQRVRARQACLACNARRIRCNVTEQQPCANCVSGGSQCEVRASRRGKHPRPSKKRRTQSDATAGSIGDESQHPDEVAASHVLASLHRNRPSDGLNQTLPGVESLIPPSGNPLTPRHEPRQEDDGDVFLGESTALRYVPDETSSTLPGISPNKGVRLRHSVPNAVKAEALIPQWEVDRRQARIRFLTSEGAFSFPHSPIAERLLQAYFEWFHPCFAVVDEMDTWNQYRKGMLSPLLLQALLFIGVLHCEENTLQDLGFGSRHRAKYIFYNRAKDIYDVEYERKKFTVLQALFLMSFWRAGALLEKDTRHWLGCAITLAQTKALHRSAGKAMSQEAKLRKRIWWSIYTRDRQCSAALGLPNRVRDEDCDAEPLEMSDFDHAFHPAIAKEKAEEYASYAVAMTELATLLGKVVHSGYLPNKTLNSLHRSQMRDELTKWKLRLPPAMQPDNSELSHAPSFHTNMQHLAYNNLLILLYRQGLTGSEEDSREVDGSIALHAAARNSTIVEHMLSDGNLRHGQIHVITNLFNTLCIHIVQLKRSEGTTKAVAEHRAKLSLLGLQELQKTWEVTNWVLQLFFYYLDRATAARLRVQGDEYAPNRIATPLAAGPTPTLQQSATPDITPGISSDRLPPSDVLQTGADLGMPGATPWSWTSEEQNQFLFNHIENEFSFGEGEMLDWTTEETAAFSNPIFQPNVDTNFMP